MARFVRLALSLALTLTVSGHAQAALMDSFSGLPTELVNQSLTVDLFDDAGGTLTLTKVTLTLSGGLTSQGSVTSDGSTQFFNVSTFSDQFDGTPGGGAPAALPTLEIIAPFTTIHTQPYAFLTGTDAFGPGGTSNSAMFMTTDPTELAQFVGLGSFSYLINTDIRVSSTGTGITTAISTAASATLEVSYDFISTPQTVIPEPSAALVYAAGLSLVGLRLRSRRRSR